MRVSDKNLYNKKHDSYRNYVFYEHNIEYIPWKIFLSNVTGRYNSFHNGSKTMNFIFNDDSLGKFYEIFEDIQPKSGFEINNCAFGKGYGPRFKTKVSDKTCFRQNDYIKEDSLPTERADYNCMILVNMESVYFKMILLIVLK